MMLIFLVSLSTVVASEMDDTDIMTTDGNLTDDLAVQDTAIDESVQENANDEQSSGSDVLSASSDEDVLGAGTFSNLNSAINTGTVPADRIIKLQDDYVNSNSAGRISIQRSDVIIDGQGHYIDANKRSGIFSISGSNVNITLKNIVFKNTAGNAAVDITCSGGNPMLVTIENCTFMDCANSAIRVYYYNVAVPNPPAITIKDTNLLNCNQSAIYLAGPSTVPTMVVPLIIENCEFRDCYSTSDGGAINLRAGAWDFRINQCTFDNCVAKDRGGVFYSPNLNKVESTLNVTNSVFDKCKTTASNSQGIYSGGGSIHLTGQSCTGYFDSCKFINNSGNLTQSEGSVMRFSGTMYINNCLFDSNVGNNGAVCAGSDNVYISITNSNFTNNHVNRWGGALQVRNADITGCIRISPRITGNSYYTRFKCRLIKNYVTFPDGRSWVLRLCNGFGANTQGNCT